MRIFAQTFLILFLACGAMAQSKRLPKFEDYRVSKVFFGQPARAKIDRDARFYRTRITSGAKEGANFAGHYTFVSWGCGADCRMFAIVDSKTGTVYFPNKGFDEVIRVPFQTDEHFEFRKDSRLLIVSGMRYGADKQDKARVSEDAGKFYYRWTGNRLVLIRSTKLNLRGESPF
jgi:hypothetical protein